MYVSSVIYYSRFLMLCSFFRPRTYNLHLNSANKCINSFVFLNIVHSILLISKLQSVYFESIYITCIKWDKANKEPLRVIRPKIQCYMPAIDQGKGAVQRVSSFRKSTIESLIPGKQYIKLLNPTSHAPRLVLSWRRTLSFVF